MLTARSTSILATPHNLNCTLSKAAVVDATASGHSAMVSYLQRQGVNTVICGGIGGGAVSALAGAGIRLFAGATGSADQAVLALLAGKLVHNPEAAKGHCGGHH